MSPSLFSSISTCARFFRPLTLASALLFLGACAEVENLRLIKEHQDTAISDLHARIRRDGDAHDQELRQMKNQLDSQKEILQATRDSLQKAETQRTERERSVERENLTLQGRLGGAAAEIARQKQTVERQRAQITESDTANASLRKSGLEKDASLAALQAQVAASKKEDMLQNTQIENLNDAVEKAKKDLKQVAVLQKQIAEKEKIITDYKTNMDKLDANLERLHVAINEKDSVSETAEEDKATLQKRADALDKQIKDIQSGKVILDADFKHAQNLLQLSLEPLADAAAIYSDSRGLVVALKAKYLFLDGKVELDPEIISTLDQIADILKKYPSKFVEVQGHTDSDPVVRMNYADNWALGWARADLVTRYLIDHANLPPKRVKSASCSQFRSPQDESIKSNKDMLRRVEIIMSLRP